MGQGIAIHTEPEEKGWILRRCAEELERRIPEARISDDPGAINYFLNYALFRPMPGIPVAFFTHLEEAGPHRAKFLSVLKEAQWGVFMNRRMRDFAVSQGFPEERSRVIRCGCSPELLGDPPVFGVCGRVYRSGRKGEHLVSALLDEGFRFLAWGGGWDARAEPAGGYPEFWRRIDYLLIPSLNEGGPVPLLDAVAAKVPVIAPKGVGWCDEFPCIRYEAGNLESLRQVLRGLCEPPTWEQWAEGHRALFQGICTAFL